MPYRPVNAKQELLSEMELGQIWRVQRWEVGPSREGSRREAGMQKSSLGKFLDNLGFSLLDSRMVRSPFHGPMKAGDWSTFARAYNGLSWFLETSGDVNPVLPGALHPSGRCSLHASVLPPAIFP